MVRRTAAAAAMILMAGWLPCSAKPVPSPPLTLYVAVNGSDAWSGKSAARAKNEGPFRTIEHARDEARRIRSSAGGRAVQVMIRGGVYILDSTLTLDAGDSGTANSPAVFGAYNRENVVLSGGRTLAQEAFEPVDDPAVLRRLRPGVREKIVRADVRAAGITDPGSFPVKPYGFPPVSELFFNDGRMTIARWPDSGWADISKIIDAGYAAGGKSPGGIFEYSGDRPFTWDAGTGVWLHGYWCYDWRDEIIKVKSIDITGNRIALAASPEFGIASGNRGPRRYYALNLIEELDQPGEYFLDSAAGFVYFYPPGPLAGARIALSRLRLPVMQIDGASNLILRGLTVQESIGSGIIISGGKGVRVQACEVRNTGELGISVSGGTGHTVEACDVHDTGTGGISLQGGDRRRLLPAGHEAVNNHIWRFSQRRLTYSSAISLRGVGNRATHNLIHDAPHMAVSIMGNDHVFEYNVVHDVVLETDDSGALYKGRDPSSRGNMIRHNFWYNIGGPAGFRNAAVYLDDGDGGETIFGNVFFRCGEPGQSTFGAVFSHGGHDNLAQNNIFIECKRALGSSPWDDKRWKQALAGGLNLGWTEKLLREVNITRPPYTTRYPALIGFMNPQPGQPRVNRAARNVFVKCASVTSGNWQSPAEENLTVDHDPGFVDPANGDFRLRKDSEVFTRLPGFRPIPFESIGLLKDEWRRTVVKEATPGFRP